MMRKAIDLTIIFSFILFVCASVSLGQVPHGAEKDDRELAPRKGKAVSVFNVPSYTIIELEEKNGPIWIAVPTMEVKAGDKVWASKGIEMREFYSKVLDRTFPVIYFVGRAVAEGKDSKKVKDAVPSTKKGIDKPKTSASPIKGSIAKAKGGYTLEELFGNKKNLAAKKVAVRGKVVKSSGRIMGKRWFHLQDGTGSEGVLDLVVTSAYDAEVGDIILITGILGINKDFGQGYKYDVILEDAKIDNSPTKGSIKKAKGGYTLKEIFDGKKELGGEKVVVRGKVVKASGKIMGKRWFHLQDGTGKSGNLDLVVTSADDANAGDIVLITGVLGLGKDFGQGYKYDVILEDAKIKIE